MPVAIRMGIQSIHEVALGSEALALDTGRGVLAAATAAGEVWLLDHQAQVTGRLSPHADIVKDVSIGPDGRIASVSRDGAVMVSDPATGVIDEVGRHDQWSMGVTWSPDGSRLASVSEDGTMRVWSAAGGELGRQDFGYPVNAVDWSPDGALLAVAGGDRKLYLIDAALEPVTVFPTADQMLWSVSFSPRGDRLAWTGRDRLLRLADPHDVESASSFPGHLAQVWDVSWHPSGERLVTAAADDRVGLWQKDGVLLGWIDVGSWARGARWLNGRLVVATEAGSLRYLAADRLDTPDVATPQAPPPACSHFEPRFTASDVTQCMECTSTSELRLCMFCGHVGCCESQLAHATKHWEDTGHPITTPTPAGDYAWRWCYEDDMYVKRVAPSPKHTDAV